MRKRYFINVLPAVILIATLILFTPRAGDALNENHTCNFCHSLHNAPGQTLAKMSVVEDLCMSCHGPVGTSVLKAEVHTNKNGSSYPAFTMSCMDCHNPHDAMDNWLGGLNIKLVGTNEGGTGEATISTPNSGVRDVVFESRGTGALEPTLHSFADGDEDGNAVYDGVCETCHTLTSFHRNSSAGNHTHEVGNTCTDCHPHDGSFIASGGGCTTCHASIKNGRRAVAGEFSLTSHHVEAGAVTDDDCGVCHYEAQGDHMDGNVDLLDPDTGSRLTPFTAFSRTRSTDILESWVTDVQNNLCLKCHDNDGATATNFSGNALRPFSSGTRDVPDVFAQFNTGNAYHHAVRGAGNNSFCNSTTMAPPWNQVGDHDQISCFDCHDTSGHGSSNQRMLRDSIDFATMEATSDPRNLPDGMGLTVETFCTTCHQSSVYVSGGSGSKYEYHGSNQNQHSAAGGNELGCMGCHGGVVNFGGVINNASHGNIHGGSFTWGSDSWALNSSSKFFMVGGWISGWKENTSAGNNGCGGGDCNHSGNVRRREPGQEYTNN